MIAIMMPVFIILIILQTVKIFELESRILNLENNINHLKYDVSTQTFKNLD